MTGFPPHVNDQISARSSGMCEVMIAGVCTYQPGPNHHRRPRGCGGSRRSDTSTAANGLSACPPCHGWIEDNRLIALANGWLIPNNRKPMVDPETVPVMWRGQQRWLDSSGLAHDAPPTRRAAS